MKKIIKKAWRAVGTRPSFAKINQLMFDCALHGLGIKNYENPRVSGELNFVGNILNAYVEKEQNPIFFDVGANEGAYIELLKEHHSNASIFAFEPNPKTFQKLLQRFGRDNKVRVTNNGLGSEESVLKFYDRKGHGGSSEHGSLYKAVIEEIHKDQVVEMDVDITTLDSFVAKGGIDRINLLKIDTEGHELEVLKGASKLINEANIDLLHIEFNEMNIISRVFFRDIAAVLEDYVPFRLLPSGVLKLKKSPLRTELFAFQNLVFVHKRLQPDKAMMPSS